MAILHLIDPTTPRDALEMLAGLISPDPSRHGVLVLGHARFLRAAIRLGIPGDLLTHVHSMGWADPSTWRAVGRIVRQTTPAHVHAWGIRGIAAATMARHFTGQRIATFAGPPSDSQLKLLQHAHRRASWTWTAGSAFIQSQLAESGLPDVRLIRPAIAAAAPLSPAAKAALRKQIGITAGDSPIILIGGEHEPAATPRFALWSAGILWQLFPHTRVIVRSEDEWSRPGPAATRLFASKLPFAATSSPLTAFAPPELSWQILVQLADIFLVTPSAPIATGSILHAQAAGVPVIGTDISCVREIVEHERTGLLARAGQPRSITARLEEWLARPETHEGILKSAREQIITTYAPQNMLNQFAALTSQIQNHPHPLLQ